MSLTIDVSGTFWRITFAEHAGEILNGVRHAEGRYHQSGQSALYLSPTPEFAAIAVDTYVKTGDPPRVITPLALSNARLCDLRDPHICARLGFDPDVPSVPWAPQRALGQSATSWTASDAVRATNAHGMIYKARTLPGRWHVVLFRWNEPDGADLSIAGPAMPWSKTRARD